MPVEKSNIFLSNTNTSMPYVSSPKPIKKDFPQRDKSSHAKFIGKRLSACYERSAKQKQAAAIRYKKGVYLEFVSLSKHDLAIKSLENKDPRYTSFKCKNR